MIVDLHLHSGFSFDSSEKYENYLSEARRRGESILGFSEHYDLDAIRDGAQDISLADISAYRDKILRLRHGFNDVLFGIEFGYRASVLNEYRALIDKYDFDYVINSVHSLEGRGDCYHNSFFDGKPLEESYRDYLNAVYESVTADWDYQIVGHIGYASRYRKGGNVRITYNAFSDIFDKILTEIIRRDKCLEVNTSTGVSGSAFLPDEDILRRYIALGGRKLSFGSDAHSADKYLKRSAETAEMLKRLGVHTLYYYKKRIAIAYNI